MSGVSLFKMDCEGLREGEGEGLGGKGGEGRQTDGDKTQQHRQATERAGGQQDKQTRASVNRVPSRTDATAAPHPNKPQQAARLKYSLD